MWRASVLTGPALRRQFRDVCYMNVYSRFADKPTRGQSMHRLVRGSPIANFSKSHFLIDNLIRIFRQVFRRSDQSANRSVRELKDHELVCQRALSGNYSFTHIRD